MFLKKPLPPKTGSKVEPPQRGFRAQIGIYEDAAQTDVHMLFRVIEKETNKVFLVYSVRNDSAGYPHFLIYNDGQWIWKSAKYFFPSREYRLDKIPEPPKAPPLRNVYEGLFLQNRGKSKVTGVRM